MMNAHTALAKKVAAVAHLRGTFKLRSGAVSSEYFDKYRFEADPVILRAVAERLAQRLPSNYDVLAGLEMGGIPIATMLSQVTGKPALFVRKKAKDYGTCKFAEGGEVSGRRLLIVEDVACVIDRCSGGRENLERTGLRLVSLFTMADLKSV